MAGLGQLAESVASGLGWPTERNLDQAKELLLRGVHKKIHEWSPDQVLVNVGYFTWLTFNGRGGYFLIRQMPNPDDSQSALRWVVDISRDRGGLTVAAVLRGEKTSRQSWESVPLRQVNRFQALEILEILARECG